MLISYYANKKSSPRLPSWQPSLISFNTPIDSGSIIKPCTLKHFQVPILAPGLLVNMNKYFMWIHYERLHNHNKAKHNKTVCIFLGIYCAGYHLTCHMQQEDCLFPYRLFGIHCITCMESVARYVLFVIRDSSHWKTVYHFKNILIIYGANLAG